MRSNSWTEPLSTAVNPSGDLHPRRWAISARVASALASAWPKAVGEGPDSPAGDHVASKMIAETDLTRAEPRPDCIRHRFIELILWKLLKLRQIGVLANDTFRQGCCDVTFTQTSDAAKGRRTLRPFGRFLVLARMKHAAQTASLVDHPTRW
jgi:hypothetical protein